MSNPMPLKYLFTATFADGSIIQQTAEDKSELEPGMRSQFYDVLHRIESGIPIHAFVLKGEGREYGVDLRDGHFEIDGIPFRMHEDDHAIGFELIFFRRHTHDFLVGKTTQHESKHTIVYRIGWKLIGNQTYQRVMQID